MFNGDTGSDTEASGAGPATALHSLLGAHTNGAASTTIQLPAATDLSGVATDGTHALWLNTAAGRQFTKITGKNDGADTVTVEDSFNIALISAVDWAIGGKRATLDDADSRTLFGTAGAKGGWSIHVETDQTLTSALDCAANITTVGSIRFRGVPSSGEFIKITQTANDQSFDVSGGGWRIRQFWFVNTNGTKTNATGLAVSGTVAGVVQAYRCKFGDATDRLGTGAGTAGSTQNKLALIDCEVLNCDTEGVSCGTDALILLDCWIHDNDEEGIATTNVCDHLQVEGCVIEGNGADGIQVEAEVNPFIKNNTVHGNGASGILVSGADVNTGFILGNQLTGNTRYGLEVAGGTTGEEVGIFADWNNFGSGGTVNTLGARLNISAGDNDLAVDPGYVNAAGNNFETGQNTRAQGFPDSARTIGANQSSTNTFVDIGAAQRDEALGGVITGARRTVR